MENYSSLIEGSEPNFRPVNLSIYSIWLQLSIHTVIRQHMRIFGSRILSENRGFTHIDIDVDGRHAINR